MQTRISSQWCTARICSGHIPNCWKQKSLGIHSNSNNLHPLVAYFCNVVKKQGGLETSRGSTQSAHDLKTDSILSVSACIGLSRDPASVGEFAWSWIKLLV